MPASHAAATSIAAGSTNAAGATKTGTVVDLTACYGAFLTAAILNGGTGPSNAANVNVYASHDNSNFKLIQQVTAGIVASTNYPFSFVIDAAIMYLRVDVSGNAGQTVTCEALLSTITGL